MKAKKQSRRGAIFLGDLARALQSLNCRSDEEAQRVAACLGFGVAPTERPRPPVEIYDPRTDQPPPHADQRPRTPMASLPPLPPAAEPPPALPAGALPSTLEVSPRRVEPAELSAPDWLDKADTLYGKSYDPLPAPRESLFGGQTHRHIISASLATRRAGQDIDVPKLLEAVCRRKVLPDLPRRVEATLELGCHLLLDYSATMVPFWDDLNSLTTQVERLIGSTRLRVYSFDGRPTEATYWTASGERKPWTAGRRPVLAATDFGLMGKAGRAQLDPAWTRFIEDCARDGSPLIILVPWPKTRWPLNIGGYPSLIHWSPHTSVAMVKRKLGSGHLIRR